MTPVIAVCLALFVNVPTGGPAVVALDTAPTASPSPAATPAPVITSWLGVSLGEASKDVRAQLGKPRQIVPSSVGDLWRYDTDNGNVTLELVINQDQVLNIAARLNDGKHSSLADPFGGEIGMNAQALQTVRGTPIASYDNGANLAYGEAAGVRWFYAMDNGVVSGIEVSKPLPPPPAAQVIADAAHDGSTLDKALVVKAATQTDGTNAEVAFLHKLTCENGGSWQISGEEFIPVAGRFFDLYHVSCSTTKLTHDYYFDITASYGK
jgi:hypothetical protein